MFIKDEREALVKFLEYNVGDFRRACAWCDVGHAAIIGKVRKNWMTQAEWFELNKLPQRGTPSNRRYDVKLTERQSIALLGFLRDRNREFASWCVSYSCNPAHIRTNIQKMTGGKR